MQEPSAITEGWPTHPLGWLVALCSRRLREGLIAGFARTGHRISPEQWGLLAQLWRSDGLPQQVLADRFHKSKVAAFHLITRLEEQELVVRRPNPQDGRSNLIYLTPEGRATVAELIPIAQGNLDRALAGIPSADVDTTRSVLLKISENLGEPFPTRSPNDHGAAAASRSGQGRGGEV